MVTVNELIVELQKIVALNPKFGEFPCIYSEDDKGNWHHSVISTPKIVYVKNEDGEDFDLEKNRRYLEIQKFYDNHKLMYEKSNCNAVIIN